MSGKVICFVIDDDTLGYIFFCNFLFFIVFQTMLDYEKNLLLDILSEDGLVIAGK